VLHHHDLAWQRPLLGNVGAPPEHRYWRHVTVNDLSRGELAARGIEATTIRNHFDPRPIPGDRRATRFDAGIPSHATVVLQPTRAIARKRVAAGLALAEALGATYWLTERAEEGWERELARVLAGATVPVVHRALRSVADAYAAADLVVLPSSWEGFGNPAVEAGLHGRPVAVGPYPVATELQGLGFDWYDADDPGTVRLPGHDLAAANAEVARRHLNLNDLPARLAAVLDGLAW
jgi:glycosyltransferase involved in cell wall biosynthesis